jgi:HEPN domain-containing protein
LADVKERFPSWFKAEIDYLCDSSRILSKKREPSLYGGEEDFLSPDEVINKNDAEDATIRAEKTYRFCERLLDELEGKYRPLS